MSDPNKTIRLGFVPSAYTLIALGALLLVPPTVLMIAVLLRMYKIDIPMVSLKPPACFLTPQALFLYVFAPAFACFVFWLRQSGGAKVTWDEHGVTEWDAKGVRMAIPWGKLRRSIVQVIVRTKGGGRYSGGQIHQLSDGEGRRISMATSDGKANWMFHRRMHTSRSTLDLTGHEPHGGFPPGDEVQPDDPRRTGWLFYMFTRLGYIAAIGAAGVVGLQRPSNKDVGLAFMLLCAGSVLLFLRLLRPFAELRRLWKLDKEMEGSFAATITDNKGTLVTATDHLGKPFQFDTAPLDHPDGLLHLRRTGVRYVVDAEQVVAQGAGGPVPIKRLEHDGIRDARATLKRAIIVEMICRAGVASILALTALALLLAS